MKRKSVKTRVDFDDRVAKRYFKELNVIRQGEGGGEDRDSSEDENYPSMPYYYCCLLFIAMEIMISLFF
jgi:hypothetical protein